MNSSVSAILAAQGSKEKNGFEVFLTTFEGGLFNFLWAKNRRYEKIHKRVYSPGFFKNFLSQNRLPLKV